MGSALQLHTGSDTGPLTVAALVYTSKSAIFDFTRSMCCFIYALDLGHDQTVVATSDF